jgi:hypothetical protein
MHVCELTSVPSEARLSAVHERDRKRRRDRLVQIRVIEKDVRRLTAEFKRDTLHCRGPSRMIDLPTATEPVNEVLATSGLRTISVPTTSPRPMTTL